MIAIKASRQAITFKVVVQPRSSKAAIVGTHLDMLKIKLTAAPVDGAANKQCLQLIAKALGLPKSWLSIDTEFDAGWSSLVARRAHNPKVTGSNPVPATK
jgi:uncharacterized protein YggU (UPF0235/DUF167 family)